MRKYECICVKGVTGKNCEVDINECESSPCFQGTCIDEVGGYSCECDEGFEGEHCDIDINECEKYKPCVYGHCIDKKANYFCDCEPNYGGKNCSVQLTGCDDNPCSNNGTCKPYLINENMQRFNCSCPNGYHGPVCKEISTMSLSGKSLIMINTSREEGYDVQFRFKTTLGDGLLALGKGLTYYILELSRGRLNLHSSLLNKWEGVFIGSNLNDSNWQRVFVAINSTHLVLSANDEQTIYPITFNENYNTTYTSFPLTYIGGIPSNLKKLTHGQPFLVGCTEDVLINGEWILPDVKNPSVVLQNVEKRCSRKPQCNPNPCHSGGHCTDLWLDFRCTCGRPYLGHTCQYNYTAATFGYENITDSLVTVSVDNAARRAVRTIVDISMFIRTRQARGQIFYLGSPLGSALGSANLLDETYIAAQLEGGELLVRIQFNGTPEAYTVGGVKLDNGYNHLIEVIRNVTLVQVKLNGTEYFRKTISATGTLDAQVLFLGGQPQQRSVRQANDNLLKSDIISPTTSAAIATPLSNIHFKGIIQDVQISNGSSTMVVEFFPLQVNNELEIPMSFGKVGFDKSTVLEGVHSDDSCRINPCRNGTCENTWNDYRCICARGYKGKDCSDKEFCELQKCPDGSVCKNLEDGYECIANATFDGKSAALQYRLVTSPNSTKTVSYDTLELTYRTRSWGTLLFAKYNEDYFVIFIYHNEVVIEWSIANVGGSKRFRKDHFEGQWLTIYLEYKNLILKGGFKDMVMDEAPNIKVINFDVDGLTRILKYGVIYIGGSDNQFDYQSIIDSADYNLTGYIPASDTTTTVSITSNSLEIGDLYPLDTVLHKVDQNKTTDIFKGCLNEIRIGGLLLPFFQPHLISPKDDNFQLYSVFQPEVGCILCYNADCFNQGSCINAHETYKCNCTDGYTADDCSIDINECENHQCENGATCLDLIGRYECQCPVGYNGTNCENEIDECLSNPCRHGGTCIDQIGTFKCECPDEFVGKQCEAPLLITCDNQPCKEGSTCKPGPNELTNNNFTCFCMEGMEGPLCDTPFCAKRHCENGKCSFKDAIPFCDCDRGFEGKYCETNIDDCVSPTGGSPCQNGGICKDGINRYDCVCEGTGYTGLLCEMDINECELVDQPCGSQGICENMPGTYKCSCSIPQKCGHSCALDDPCETEQPCTHGTCVAQCLDKPDYVCNCHDNYTGKNCTDYKVAASQADHVNVLYIVIPIVLILTVGIAIGMAILVNIARSKRATRGTYSPSAQEFCNPRVELDHVLKPPPEERLI
ncbi:crumbs [Asbolus verrucosus]|uniref:Crumbs n=1 Tax=Asbolus verrucosus TaxID=1661398 RepID=A0A482WAF8_ASBVE|nr:crumbs [Asbolus verrucosus]